VNTSNPKFKITVCASGGGGNFASLIRAQEVLDFEISQLIVDRVCGAVDVATAHDIPYEVLIKKDLGVDFFNVLVSKITQDVDLVVLAGFMPIIPPFMCEKFAGRMINTHPSLLPSYGGKGMYGVKVQEAVMAAKEKYAGCTVHFVSPEIDGGDIILQKTLLVDQNETPWELGGRIFKEENILLVEAVKKLMEQRKNG